MPHTLRTGALAVAALCATLALASCDRGEQRTAASDSAGFDTSAGSLAETPASVATGVVAMLSDENVFALLDTAYAALLQTDRLAQERSTNPAVRDLAGTMISQNALARSGIRSTAERLNVSPALPDRDVIGDHAAAIAELQQKRGSDFDRAYLDRVITSRADLIDEVDDAIEGGNVRQSAVREFLQQVRSNLEADRRRAEELRQGAR
jgi:putative membrane protein